MNKHLGSRFEDSLTLDDKLGMIVLETVDKMNSQIEGHIFESLVEILTDMIKSGDIQRVTQIQSELRSDGFISQSLVYVPYRGQDALKTKIRGLEQALEEAHNLIVELTLE